LAFALPARVIAQTGWQIINPYPQGGDLDAVSFVDQNHGVAISGNQTTLVVWTSDGGETWDVIRPSVTGRVRDVHMLDSVTAVVVGDGGYLARTTDRGVTWNLTPGFGQNMHEVHFSSSTHGITSGYDVASTTDGGQSWTKHAAVDAGGYGVWMVDDTIAYAVGQSAAKRTNDGGMTWVDLNHPATGRLEGVAFMNADHGVIVGGDKFYTTTDGGTSWTTQTSTSTAHSGAFGESFWAVTYVGDSTFVATGYFGAIARSIDGGFTWTAHNFPEVILSQDLLYDVSFSDSLNGRIVGQTGRILKTTDGGINWVQQSRNIGGSFAEVTFVNDSTILAVGSDRIAKTTDLGATWLNIPSGFTEALNDIHMFNDSNGIVVGASGRIIGTTDGGLTWTNRTSGSVNHQRAVFFVDSVNGFSCGHGGEILQTTDGGATWSKQVISGGGDFYDIAFTDSQHGIAVSNTGVVARTTDGGTTWQDTTIQGSPNLQGISYYSGDAATAVGYSGAIYRSTDRGISWVQQIHGTANHLHDVEFTSKYEGTIVGFKGIEDEVWHGEVC